MTRILVLTPTLGKRSSLVTTVASVLGVSTLVRDVVELDYLLVVPRSVNLSQFSDQVQSVPLFIQPDNVSGVFAALNSALNSLMLSYDYFAYINDDDYWLPSYEKLIREVVKGLPAIAIGRTLLKRENISYPSAHFPFTYLSKYLFLLGKSPFTQQSMLFSRRIILDTGFFDESLPLNADIDFLLRAFASTKSCLVISPVCSVYCQGPDRITSDPAELRAANRILRGRFRFSRILSVVSVLMFWVYNFPLYTARLLNPLSCRSGSFRGLT
jgi:hypothetical protein